MEDKKDADFAQLADQVEKISLESSKSFSNDHFIPLENALYKDPVRKLQEEVYKNLQNIRGGFASAFKLGASENSAPPKGTQEQEERLK